VIELVVNAAVESTESQDASRISADDVARVLEEIVFNGKTTRSNVETNGSLVLMNPKLDST
jgi:hypothetical protein